MNPSTRRSLFAGTVLAALLALPLTVAAASEMVGQHAGETADEIRANLAAQSYEIRKVETEDGALEAYALKEGKRFEIYVDPATGAVSRVKAED